MNSSLLTKKWTPIEVSYNLSDSALPFRYLFSFIFKS